MLKNGWSFVYEGFDPDQEKLREALCTLGNGLFATRGAAPETEADDTHYPGTYLAGGYNRLSTQIDGNVVENDDLVNMPNWLPLTFRIEGGEWFNLRNVELLSYRQELDIKGGVLLRAIRFRDGAGHETSLTSRRFVHMAQPHLAGLETMLTPVNWSGRLEIRSALDGRIENDGVARYRRLAKKHLEPLETGTVGGDGTWLRVRTSQSRIEVAEAARTQVSIDGARIAPQRTVLQEDGYIADDLAADVREGSHVRIEKIVALYSSKDRPISECGLAARQAIERAPGFDELIESHALAWEHLWRRCNIDVIEGERTELIMRLHIFHLLQTASPNTIDLDVSVPARGWTGEAYRGHIFWDELFIFQFLNLRMPEITRSLLMYRYRRLNEARRNASEAGYRGAMYPWQCSSDGREESQKLHLNPRSGHWVPDNSPRQRHINVAIAWNIWQYYQVTGDTAFMHSYGAEMFIEIARFWASISQHNEGLDRYEILGVMGPDEYHDGYPNATHPGGLDNNAYTNVMVVWVLCRASEIIEQLPADHRRELLEKLDLREPEIARWDDVSRKMRVVFHDGGIISQFEGYEHLMEFDWATYREKYGDIQRLDRILEAEDDTTNRYKLSKQADVLMLFYLLSAGELRELFQRLGYDLDADQIRKNIHYYLQRTSHGSTLSRVVHSWVLARSDRPQSWRLFMEALESDVADIQGGTTPEGIHLGAMAGTIDLVQRGYTGLEMRGGVLWFNPSLPGDLMQLAVRIRYRQHWLRIEATCEQLTLSADDDSPGSLSIGFKERVYQLAPGETKTFDL